MRAERVPPRRARRVHWALSCLSSIACLTPLGATAAETTVIQKSASGYSLIVTVTPKVRDAARRVSVTLDLAETPAVPDPTFGDRVPVRGASLIAAVHREGGPTTHYGLHPLMGAGVYGFHFTPSTTGLYHIVFRQRGADLPELDFAVGVGVDTPDEAKAPAQAMGLRETLRGGGARPIGTLQGPILPNSGKPNARKVMEAMAEPAGLLSEALYKKRPLRSEVDPAIDALLGEAKKLGGTVPDRYRSAASDYDQMASELVSKLEALKKKAAAGPRKAAATRAAWGKVLDGTCARCHVKFWWAITPDLAAWPRIEPKPWKR